MGRDHFSSVYTAGNLGPAQPSVSAQLSVHRSTSTEDKKYTKWNNKKYTK